ncbi:hypothetical protein CN933_17150 [Sinorhizobium sp. M4_45]|nr:hypothetical protein CN933_17150 [Sinorhizobium sp. M4_45]
MTAANSKQRRTEAPANIAEYPAGQHDQRKGDAEEEDGDESRCSDADYQSPRERALPPIRHGTNDNGDQRRFQAEEQLFDNGDIAERGTLQQPETGILSSAAETR